jgi:hypothetical protein
LLIRKHAIAIAGEKRTDCRCRDKTGKQKLVESSVQTIHLTMLTSWLVTPSNVTRLYCNEPEQCRYSTPVEKYAGLGTSSSKVS